MLKSEKSFLSSRRETLEMLGISSTAGLFGLFGSNEVKAESY